LKEVSVPELLFAFEALCAKAFVDSHVKPLEELKPPHRKGRGSNA
jgi:hypothetical protein